MKNIISLKSDIKLVTQINSQQFFSDKDKLMTKLEGMERTRIKKRLRMIKNLNFQIWQKKKETLVLGLLTKPPISNQTKSITGRTWQIRQIIRKIKQAGRPRKISWVLE